MVLVEFVNFKYRRDGYIGMEMNKTTGRNVLQATADKLNKEKQTKLEFLFDGA